MVMPAASSGLGDRDGHLARDHQEVGFSKDPHLEVERTLAEAPEERDGGRGREYEREHRGYHKVSRARSKVSVHDALWVMPGSVSKVTSNPL